MKKSLIVLALILSSLYTYSQNQLTNMERVDGFELLFNGENLNGWIGNKIDYVAEDGMIVMHPDNGGEGNIYTEKEFANFVLRFEFQLTPGANNGLGVRAPLNKNAAYKGMELQILDNTADKYKDLQKYQYHGSVYGVIPAKRGFLLPVGEWNKQEVIADGDSITVVLNGEVILAGNIKKARKGGTMDGEKHPGLKKKTGHVGFLGHGDVVRFRSIRIKEIAVAEQ